MRILTVLILILAFSSLSAQRAYVDANVQGGSSDGSTWQNAYSDLETALDAVCSGQFIEIWAAIGAYHPPTENGYFICREAKLYGGFTSGDTSLSQRNARSVIDGNLENGNANTLFAIENGTGIVVDGFVFTGGSALSTAGVDGQEKEGGAIYSRSSSFKLSNCEFTGNMARSGGAIYLGQGSDVKITQCTFNGNISESFAGAVYVTDSEAKFHRCHFKFNTAEGGAGAVFTYNSNVSYSNCSANNNVSQFEGGFLYSVGGENIFGNCTFERNTTAYGSVVYSINADVGIYNCISFNNGDSPFASIPASNFFYSHSLIEGSGGSSNWDESFGFDQGGNIDGNPNFFEENGFKYNIDSTSIAYRTGNTEIVSVPLYSPDNTGLFVDILGNPRLDSTFISMGAMEPVQVETGTFTSSTVQDRGDAILGIYRGVSFHGAHTMKSPTDYNGAVFVFDYSGREIASFILYAKQNDIVRLNLNGHNGPFILMKN